MDESTLSTLGIESGSAVAAACHLIGIFAASDSFSFNFDGEVTSRKSKKIYEVGSPGYILGAGVGCKSTAISIFRLLENKASRERKLGKLLTGKDCARTAVPFLSYYYEQKKLAAYEGVNPDDLRASLLFASYESQQQPFKGSFYEKLFKQMVDEVEEVLPLDGVIPFKGSYIDGLFKKMVDEVNPKEMVDEVIPFDGIIPLDGFILFKGSYIDSLIKEMVDEVKPMEMVYEVIPLDGVITFKGSYIDGLFKEMVDEVKLMKMVDEVLPFPGSYCESLFKEMVEMTPKEFDIQSYFSSEEFKETRRQRLYFADEVSWETLPSHILGHLTKQARKYFRKNFDYRSEKTEAFSVLINGMLDAFKSAGCGGKIKVKYINEENKIKRVRSKKIRKIRKRLQ